MWNKLRGLTYVFFITYGAFGSSLALTPWILGVLICSLILESLKLYGIAGKSFYVIDIVQRIQRKYVRFLARNYFCYSAAFIEWVAGVKVIIHGNDKNILTDSNEDNKIFIVSNHRTPIDWMFGGWSYSVMLKKYLHISFVLKNPLKNVPFYGWAAQAMMWVFLQRKREEDIPRMQTVILYLMDIDNDEALSLFLFPEGTDLSNSNIIKSNQFAQDHKLPEMSYVLYPKPAGFSVCLDQLLVNNSYSNPTNNSRHNANVIIHDITIAYRDFKPGVRTVEKSIINGEFPTEIHLWVDRYDAARDVPLDSVKRNEWLRSLFLSKEQRLKSFYNDEAAVGQAPASWPPVLMTSSEVSVWQRLYAVVVVLGWTSAWLLLMWNVPLVSVASVACFSLFALSPFFGGVDSIVLHNHHIHTGRRSSGNDIKGK
mmetsp:Transcript_11406/g.15694  ORF Transcript_11406/g.15694 Transcript_11406/m.15694 type:complete len:426 (+) Transcript_11406:25-1302(+)